jgi:hypothetical protein
MAKVTAPSSPAEGEESVAPLRLQRLEMLRFTIPVVGVTPLITHKWSEKSKQMMLDKGGSAQAKTIRPKRDPEQTYQDARYRLEEPRTDGLTDGVPAVAFKAAIASAARAFTGVTMQNLKQFVYVEGEPPDMLVPIVGKPQMREDTVRVGSGQNKAADITWRPMFWPWSAELTIRWPSAVLDLESMVSLVEAAGLGGVGEWRPTSPKALTGTYGQFRIDFEAEMRKEV